ncbi:hypothetical protein F7725_008036 [Dissostichus mawsoni]|uniref:Leucine-rich repeat-containing protein 9 n=1 Tax=Dissostichus mawsoni TaxID=36200 RepID=A0A7J5Y6X1_DISMA|nr:hypothetical protein F7725_008036 [Dissostichus mawsoni]
MIQSEKQKHRGDEVVKELCMANGVCYEKIRQDGSNVSSLEIFFSGFPRMVGLSFFPRLCQLTIVGQDIKHIEGLECCPLLRELWVVQCDLTGISGLQNCVQLKKIYIYDNHICEINNLELLINLEVLWLNHNCITQIQGLDTLQNLKELNLADNDIEKIGHSLDPNVGLQNLNLSGNKISSFKELTLLARLPNLRELALKDPTSTPNPVCLLCNYATHVLYYMPGLQLLDTYDVSSKQVKDAAEATVMKKMMYYNMRVHTAQRNLAEIRLSLMERKKTMLQLPEDCIRTLNHALKSLQEVRLHHGGRIHYLVEGSIDRSDLTADISPAMQHKILSKIEALRERLQLWARRLQEIEAWYERVWTQATGMMEYTVQFLLMELESVGNIRLEEGCSTDAWYVYFLLRPPAFPLFSFRLQVHSITGIKVNRIIRIHNSALRLRFEDKLHTLLASEESALSSQNSKRRLDHLFYVADSENNSEKEDSLCIVEEGFRTSEQNEALEKDGAIPLTNSLSVAEQPRIEHSTTGQPRFKAQCGPDPLQARKIVLEDLGSAQQPPPIIVSKVFVGHSTPLREGDPLDRSRYPRLISVYRNVDVKHRTAVSQERPRSTKTHTGPECSPRRRQWFVFDHELVLPEYIIYFEYISADQEQPHSTGRDETPSNDIILDREVLNMEPVLPPQPKLLSLDDKILLNVARANVLNLHGNSLSQIKEISHLTALRHLTISFNEFTHLDDISHMPHLEFLDASYNRLVTLEGLKRLGQLKQLDLRWNKLTKAREDTAITALNFDNQRISKLINLNKLVNLRWASFNDNDISKVEGISKLHCLNKLSVDGNQLSSLEPLVLEQLPNLSFLTVENNSISSLHGIQRVRSLLELYIGNNQICTSRDIYFLKASGKEIRTGLTNLIILDLYGNPLLEKLENYRIYVVFHLPSLKALDGVAVEVTECESAKDMFGGRLTPDMVGEKLGHSNYTDITYLTLQSCSIRMVDLSPADLFCSLRSVNLDHNNLTSFSGLIYLPNIKALCLNYNHIESILPRQKTQAPLTNRQILYSKVHSSGYGQPAHLKGKGKLGTLAVWSH